MNHQLDVLIIGAGLAGLQTAFLLERAGLAVQVLEARERVGGRLFTEAVSGCKVDLGGQWAGPQQHRLLNLAQTLGVATFPQFHHGTKILSWKNKLYWFRGEIPWLSPFAMFEIWKMQRFLGKLSREVSPETPWSCPKAQQWDNISLEDWKHQNFNTAGARMFLDLVARAVCTSEPDQISLLYFLMYLRSGVDLNTLISIPGGAQQLRFQEGTQQLCSRIQSKLVRQVVLNSPVKAITQNSTEITVKTSNSAWNAQRVVVTVPPALIHEIHFSPSLPEDRKQLISHFCMGSVIKYVARYDKAFWRDAGYSGEVFMDEGPCTTTFDATSSDGQPALVTFSDGNAARKLTGKSSEHRQQAVLKELSRCLGAQAGHPIAFAQKNWIEDEWSGGCYAGVLKKDVLSRYGHALRKPCGRIHWAGTETATEWFGYMEGALQSAERVSQEMLSFVEPRN